MGILLKRGPLKCCWLCHGQSALAVFSWWPWAATSWEEFGSQAIQWQNNTQEQWLQTASEENRMINYFGKTPKPSFHPSHHFILLAITRQRVESSSMSSKETKSKAILIWTSPPETLWRCWMAAHSPFFEQQVSCFPAHPALLIYIILEQNWDGLRVPVKTEKDWSLWNWAVWIVEHLDLGLLAFCCVLEVFYRLYSAACQTGPWWNPTSCRDIKWKTGNSSEK